jgi:hypothetical protein
MAFRLLVFLRLLLPQNVPNKRHGTQLSFFLSLSLSFFDRPTFGSTWYASSCPRLFVACAMGLKVPHSWWWWWCRRGLRREYFPCHPRVQIDPFLVERPCHRGAMASHQILSFDNPQRLV